MEGSGSGERIIAHLGFARAVAARSLDPRCRGADREDLIAWGIVGLVHAEGKMQRPSATANSRGRHARARGARDVSGASSSRRRS